MKDGRYFYYECASLSSHKHLSGCPGYRVNSVQPDTLVWQWLVDLLKDEAQVERGLRRIRERREAEMEPRRKRLETVGQSIVKEEAGITRLVNSLAEIEDEFTVDTIKAQIKAKQKYRVSLVSEAERLSQELEEQSFTEEDEARIKEIAAQLRDYIDTATFKEMRYVVDRLDVQVRLRVDGPKRWLDSSCAFELPTRSIELPSSI